MKYFSFLILLGINGCTYKNTPSKYERDKVIHIIDNYCISIKPLTDNVQNNEKSNATGQSEIGIVMSFLNNTEKSIENSEYDKYIYFYSFEIGNYIKIISETDTINCTYFNSERNYNLSPISHIFIFFTIPKSKIKRGNNYSIVLLKNEFINSENVEFKINSNFLYHSL